MVYISLSEAKKQIIRISDYLTKNEMDPLLLVGGIAVNQYVTTRNSEDIDLVCDYDTSVKIVENLYSSYDWNITESNRDEYHPFFVIQHKSKKEYPIVKYGPKIIERGSYQYIDWQDIMEKTQPFRCRNKIYEKIRIPSIEILCYMKLVSFLGRIEEKESKIKQDFQEIRKFRENGEVMREGVR